MTTWREMEMAERIARRKKLAVAFVAVFLLGMVCMYWMMGVGG